MKIIAVLETACGPVDMPAEIVDVAPHLADAATFIAHKQNHKIRHHPHGYAISNLETGLAISNCDAATKKDCIRLARKILGAKTMANVKAAYRKAKQ